MIRATPTVAIGLPSAMAGVAASAHGAADHGEAKGDAIRKGHKPMGIAACGRTGKVRVAAR